jgi:hypothetical protein
LRYSLMKEHLQDEVGAASPENLVATLGAESLASGNDKRQTISPLFWT